MTTPAPAAPSSNPDRPASVDAVELNGVYWVYARHHMREVRVVAKARTRVHVAFWLAFGTASQLLQVQALPFYTLRREKPPQTRQWGFVLNWPAPSVEQVAAEVARIR